ncbi:MAG: WD40 repeat domain-containing protein [Verrucomicrobiota bacterium]
MLIVFGPCSCAQELDTGMFSRMWLQRYLKPLTIAAACCVAESQAQISLEPEQSVFEFPMVSEQAANAHDTPLADARFIHGDKTLLTLDFLQTVKLWDVATGKLEATYRVGPLAAVNSISLSPDEELLATAGKNGRMAVINLKTGKVEWDLRNTTGFIDVDFHPDGRSLLVSDDTSLVAYDRKTGKEIKRLHRPATDRDRLDAAFLSDEWLVTGSQEGTLTMWKWSTGKPEPRIISAYTKELKVEWKVIAKPQPYAVLAQLNGPLSVVNLTTGEKRPFNTGAWRISTGWDIAGPQNKLITPQLVFDFPSGKFLGRTTLTGFDAVRVSASGRYLAALSKRAWRIYRLPDNFSTAAKALGL